VPGVWARSPPTPRGMEEGCTSVSERLKSLESKSKKVYNNRSRKRDSNFKKRKLVRVEDDSSAITCSSTSGTESKSTSSSSGSDSESYKRHDSKRDKVNMKNLKKIKKLYKVNNKLKETEDIALRDLKTGLSSTSIVSSKKESSLNPSSDEDDQWVEKTDLHLKKRNADSDDDTIVGPQPATGSLLSLSLYLFIYQI
jgi:hypothetical protein